MVNYIFLITYSFDAGYISVPCVTEVEALDTMSQYLEPEIELVEREHGYTPIVLDVCETEKILVYTEYLENDGDYKNHDYAIYKVIETSHI